MIWLAQLIWAASDRMSLVHCNPCGKMCPYSLQREKWTSLDVYSLLLLRKQRQQGAIRMLLCIYIGSHWRCLCNYTELPDFSGSCAALSLFFASTGQMEMLKVVPWEKMSKHWVKYLSVLNERRDHLEEISHTPRVVKWILGWDTSLVFSPSRAPQLRISSCRV